MVKDWGWVLKLHGWGGSLACPPECSQEHLSCPVAVVGAGKTWARAWVLLWECHTPGHVGHYSFQYNMYQQLAVCSECSYWNQSVMDDFSIFLWGGREKPFILLLVCSPGPYYWCWPQRKLFPVYESQLPTKLWNSEVDSEWRHSCWALCCVWHSCRYISSGWLWFHSLN